MGWVDKFNRRLKYQSVRWQVFLSGSLLPVFKPAKLYAYDLYLVLQLRRLPDLLRNPKSLRAGQTGSLRSGRHDRRSDRALAERTGYPGVRPRAGAGAGVRIRFQPLELPDQCGASPRPRCAGPPGENHLSVVLSRSTKAHRGRLPQYPEQTTDRCRLPAGDFQAAVRDLAELR